MAADNVRKVCGCVPSLTIEVFSCARDLLRLSFHLGPGIAGHPTDAFLDFAAEILGGPGYTIFVHLVKRLAEGLTAGAMIGFLSTGPRAGLGILLSPGQQPELRDFLPRSFETMNRPFHEMSDREKREVADELKMQPTAFGILVIAAALILVVFLWSPIPDLIASAGNAAVAQQKVAYVKSPSN